MSETPTIFALSSGAPPAGVGVIRVSGPRAGAALVTLAGRLPPPRRASLARLHDGGGGALGHPRVYIDLARDGTGECGYCDRKFVLRKGARAAGH